MPKAPFVDSLGQKGKEVDLPPEIFDVQINMPILHEVINAQLAAARSGTHSTKTRAEVRGGGAKPWRQKGTGRARHGSIREPQWVGGGIAHGPKPRDYSTRINKKEKQLALKSALTDRSREGKLLVIEFPDFEEPETKKAVDLLKEWDATGRTLIVVSPKDEEAQKRAWLSFRNIPHVLTVTYPTAYTVLAADTVIFTKTALDELTSTREPSSGSVADSGEPSRAASGPTNTQRTAAAPEPSSASVEGSGDSSPSRVSSARQDSVPTVPDRQSPSTEPSGGSAPASESEQPAQEATATQEQSGTVKAASEGRLQASEGETDGGTDSRALRTDQGTAIEPEQGADPEDARRGESE